MAEQAVRRERQALSLYDILQVNPAGELNAAYDVLGDSEQRARYDAQHQRPARATGARRRPPTTDPREMQWTSSLRVVDKRLASSAGRVRFLLIVTVLMASLALALWLFIEALMDTSWAVFLA